MRGGQLVAGRRGRAAARAGGAGCPDALHALTPLLLEIELSALASCCADFMLERPPGPCCVTGSGEGEDDEDQEDGDDEAGDDDEEEEEDEDEEEEIGMDSDDDDGEILDDDEDEEEDEDGEGQWALPIAGTA